jgi:hypothetical protein
MYVKGMQVVYSNAGTFVFKSEQDGSSFHHSSPFNKTRWSSIKRWYEQAFNPETNFNEEEVSNE